MLLFGDMHDVIPNQVSPASVDVIIFDPPYGIGNKKLSHKSKKWNKSSEDWDQFDSVDEQYDFYEKCFRILVPTLKENGSIFVFGSFHNIYMIGEILQRKLGHRVINSIVWNKTNAMFNITQSSLIEGTEHIIWSCKQGQQPFFDYEYACSITGKQLRNVWSFPQTPSSERLDHPHQKPCEIISRIIAMACPVDGLVLDPMCGSGTTAVVCEYLKRRHICIERNPEYFAMARKRFAAEKELA